MSHISSSNEAEKIVHERVCHESDWVYFKDKSLKKKCVLKNGEGK